MAATLDHLDDLLTRAHTPGGACDADVRALAGELKQLALTDLKRAIDIADKLARWRCDDGALAVEVLSARAHVLCYANRFDDATGLLSEAARIAHRDGNTAALAQVRLTAVQPLARAGRLEDAQSAAEESRDAFAHCQDAIGRAKSLLNLGIVQRMRGRPDEALATFDAALPLLAGEPMLLGALSSNRAEALLDLDRFREAEGAFVSALDAFTAARNAHAAAIVEGNLADLFAREGRLDAALERFELARQHYQASGAAADVARLEAESAEAMAALGAHDAAILALGECLPALEAAGLSREWRRGQFALAWCLLAGAHDGAARGVIAGLLRHLGDDEPILRAQCTIAMAALDQKADLPTSHEPAAAALEVLRERPARLAQANAWLADAALRAGDLISAQANVDAMDANPVTHNLTAMRAQASHLRGRLLRAQGQPEQALEPLRDAMFGAERIRGALRADRWRVACGQTWRDVYLDTMSAALDTGDTHAALDALERVRGRSLLESLGSRVALATQSPLLRESLDALNAYYAKLDRGDDAPMVAARITQLEDAVERERTRADALQGERRTVGEPLPPAAIAERMPEAAAVLEYFVEDGRVGVMVVRREGVRVRRDLCRVAAVEHALARVRFAVDQDDGGAADLWDAGVRALAGALLGPMLADVDGVTTLALSLPASLERVPWPALPVGGAMLVERYDVLTTPSATAAVTLGREHAPTGTVAIGVPDDLAPGMEGEAVAVARLMSGRALTGAQASAAAVLEAVGRAGLVHLATHCVFSPRHPMASRLKLADRWLGAHELAAAVRPGARVVLAGCETGRAGGVNTEDRTGLVSALLASGASEVLSARWPLHDETAGRLFDCMYAALACVAESGRTLAAALCHAQREAVGEGVAPWRIAAVHVTGGLP
jgi:CHAT domain-containing protein